MCLDGSTYSAIESSGVMCSLEDMLDAFDAHGVPDELLSVWTSQEEAWRSWEDCHSSCPSLFHEVRKAAIQFMQHTLRVSGLGRTSIFDAAMLLDLYLMKTHTPEIVNVLPATCVALTRLVMKAGPTGKQCISFDFWSDIVRFAMWLEAQGFAKMGCHSANTVDIINSQEADILETLDWRVKFPTPEAWMSVFFSRFDVLTQSSYAHALTYARWCGISAAGFMMMKRGLSRDMPPKRVAVGLFCLSLASADVVSFDSIRPSSLGHDQWRQMLLDAGFDCMKLERTPPGAQHTVVSTFLTCAIGEGVASVLEHCHAVAFAMRCAVQGRDNVSRA